MKKMLVNVVAIKDREGHGKFFKVLDKDYSPAGYYWERTGKRDEPMHLYLVAPYEHIDDDDLVYVEKYPQIWTYKTPPCPMPYWGNPRVASKIIATTNKSLGLPAIPQWILNHFIVEKGVVEDLELLASDNGADVNSNNEVMVLASIEVDGKED